jgi:hypothetical protein
MRTIARISLAMAAAAALGVPVASAQASAPVVTTFDSTDGFTAGPGDLCAFAVEFTFHNVGTSSEVTTGQGSVSTDHVTETDTMAAFGRSITGQPYRYTITATFDANHQLTDVHAQGILWSFVLPDGTRVRAAGWADFQDHQRGLPVDLAPVCAYLAG